MTTTPKNTSASLISPRLEGYLARAKAGLADKTKSPSQHAAADRVRRAIEGCIRTMQREQEAAALQIPETNPAPLVEKIRKN